MWHLTRLGSPAPKYGIFLIYYMITRCRSDCFPLFIFSTSSCIPLRAFVWRGSFFLCRSLRRSAGFFSCFLTILLSNLCAYFAHYYFVIFDTDVQFYGRNYIPNANERAIALSRSIYYAWVCISLIFQFVFCFCSCICVDCVWMFQVLAHIAWVSV